MLLAGGLWSSMWSALSRGVGDEMPSLRDLGDSSLQEMETRDVDGVWAAIPGLGTWKSQLILGALAGPLYKAFLHLQV